MTTMMTIIKAQIALLLSQRLADIIDARTLSVHHHIAVSRRYRGSMTQSSLMCCLNPRRSCF